jgi:DNA-binding transcriptional regulator YhcF (GntR family)
VIDHPTRQADIERAVAAVRRRILDHLHLGLLTPGARLPSIRRMAGELRLSPKAVLIAYRILQGESLVVVRPRSGVFVADRQPFAARAAAQEWLVDALVQARRNGIAPTVAAEFVQRSLRSVQLKAAIFARNADQLSSIGDELREEYGVSSIAVDLDRLPAKGERAWNERDLTGLDLIVTTAFDRPAVRQLLPKVSVPICAITMCTELYAEVRRQLDARAVFFVVADERLGTNLRKMFASPNLRVIVFERDPLDVPASAPVYLTRLARRLLSSQRPNHPLLTRTLPESRVFSDDTARELTGFIIAANQLSATRGA